jgi:integrase
MFKANTSLGIPIAKDPLSDFRKFLFVIWKHLNLPEPTPVQYDIAYNLQHGDKRMIIQAFRGVGKSWITSAYDVWLLYMNPQLNILVVSASKSSSDDFTTFTLRPINERHFYRTWLRMKEAIGLEDDNQFVIHMLRDTCCTRLIEAGVDLRSVMEWMGHSSLDITQRYAHFVPERLDHAADKLAELGSGAI